MEKSSIPTYKSWRIYRMVVFSLFTRRKLVLPVFLLVILITFFQPYAVDRIRLGEDLTVNYHHLMSDKMFLESESIPAKCSMYFGQLHRTDKNWRLDVDKLKSWDIDPLIYNRKKWLSTKYKEKKKQLHRGEKLSDGDKDSIRMKYDHEMKKAGDYELSLREDATNYRIFGRCYLGEEPTLNSECRENEIRLYPWLSQKHPIVVDWEGNQNQMETNSDGCFLSNVRDTATGDGVVIPLFDKESDLELVQKLIRLLRGVQNDLPVQIIHKGDIDAESQKQLIELSRGELNMPGNSEEYRTTNELNAIFVPEQHISFVDISPVINEEHKKLLNERNIFQIMTTIFNSFENVIYMKPSVLPLVQPCMFFQTESFKSNKSLFFRKRAAMTKQKFDGLWNVDHMVRSLFPKKYDNLFFDMDFLSSRFTDNKFFRNELSSYMDSSVMVFKKSQHISGLLISLNLQFYGILKKRLGVDEDDFFWIGQNIAGNGQYRFNKHYATAVGMKTPDQNKPDYCTLSEELCSVNYGQLADDDITLLYLKNDMSYCDNAPKYDAFLSGKFIHQGVDGENETVIDNTEYMRLLRNPLTIEALLDVPTLSDFVYADFKEPKFNWKLEEDVCSQQMWCGYSIVGRVNDITTMGKMIEFSKKERARFEFLGRLWLD